MYAECVIESARRLFVQILSVESSGLKTLVMEPELIDVVDVLFKFSHLEAHGVTRIVPWTCEASDLSLEDGCFFYFCRSLGSSTLSLMSNLSKLLKNSQPKQKPTLVFSPFVSQIALDRLVSSETDVDLSLIRVLATDSLLLCPVEEDTFVIPVGDEAFSNFHCRNDPSLLSHVSHALRLVQSQFGTGAKPEDRKVRKISAIGTASKIVADSFVSMTNEAYGKSEEKFDEQAVLDQHDGNVMTGLSRVGGIHCVGGLLMDRNACAKNNQQEETMETNHKSVSPAEPVEQFVLIDRRSDLYSLLCSQFTFEALIDDTIGIHNRRVKPEEPLKAMVLSKGEDPLFGEIRDVSVSVIGQLLSKKASFISECYKQKDSLKSISEIKDFMDKFKDIQAQHASLTNHVSLATLVSDFARDAHFMQLLKIEDQIMSMAKPVGKMLAKIESLAKRAQSVALFSLERILKLLCLTSLVYGPKATSNAGLDKCVRTLFHQFGEKVIRKVHHLEQCGLLKFHNPAEPSSTGLMSELISSGTRWPKIREEFKLISSDPSADELAEPYSGYIPISVRLVQLLNLSWKASADKLNLLRGPAFEIAQECPSAAPAAGNTTNVVVVFIGGVTYGEIAALRKLSTLEAGKRRFLILTTGITSYSKIMRQM